MAKRPTLSDITTGHGTTTKINANFDAIEQAFDNTLSRDGSSPNAMEADLDMNSNQILNLPDATTDREPLTYGQYIAGGASAVVNGFRKETQTATAAQTVFTATSVEWVPGIDNLMVFVNGELQGPGLYTVDSSTQITFTSGLTLADRVDFVVMQIATTQINTTIDAGLVSYNPPGTSLVTNVETKLRESVSVKDYGALGDGVTNDLAAIQAAVDAMSNGSTIVFPQGNYIINDSINFGSKSNITVVGKKAKIIQTGSKKKSMYFSGGSYIEVRGFHFYGKGSSDHDGGNVSAAVNGAALWFDTCTALDIHDNFIENHAGGHIRSRYNGSNSRFTNNRIVGIGAAGGIVYGDNNTDIGIDIREASGISGTKNIIIANNDISETCFGLFCNFCDGVVMSNNTIRNIIGQHGIYNNRCNNMVISNNTLDNIAIHGMKAQQLTSAGGVFYNYSVTGNVINDAGSGIVFEVASGDPAVTYTEGVTITGNTITNITNNYGMSVDACRQLNIVGNTIDRTGDQGLYIRNSGQINVSQNYINLCGANAIWCSDLYDDCVIDGNFIRDAVQNYNGATNTDGRYYYYVYCIKDAAATDDPKVFFRNNLMIINASVPTLFASNGNCFRAIPGVNVYWQNNTNLTTKAWRIDPTDIMHMDLGHSPSVDFTSGGTANPTTPVYGHGRRHLYGTQDPASASMTDVFNDGDICWNATPSAGGTVGWICTTAGTPGTWKTFGTIAS